MFDSQGEMNATLVSICVADSIVAGFLCVLLWNSRSGTRRCVRSTFLAPRRPKCCTRTNSVISTLILYTVTTGLLTTVVAIATLIIVSSLRLRIENGHGVECHSQMLSMKETFAYAGAFYMLSKRMFDSAALST